MINAGTEKNVLDNSFEFQSNLSIPFYLYCLFYSFIFYFKIKDSDWGGGCLRGGW